MSDELTQRIVDKIIEIEQLKDLQKEKKEELKDLVTEYKGTITGEDQTKIEETGKEKKKEKKPPT